MVEDQDAREIEEELPEIDPATLEPAAPVPPAKPKPQPKPADEEPILLVPDEEGDPGESKIMSFGTRGLAAGEVDFQRPLILNGTGATRCRIFTSKIAPGPLSYMEKQINEWADSVEIEIKFVTQVVGVMEGKRAEPNLIVTVWY